MKRTEGTSEFAPKYREVQSTARKVKECLSISALISSVVFDILPEYIPSSAAAVRSSIQSCDVALGEQWKNICAELGALVEVRHGVRCVSKRGEPHARALNESPSLSLCLIPGMVNVCEP